MIQHFLIILSFHTFLIFCLSGFFLLHIPDLVLAFFLRIVVLVCVVGYGPEHNCWVRGRDMSCREVLHEFNVRRVKDGLPPVSFLASGEADTEDHGKRQVSIHATVQLYFVMIIRYFYQHISTRYRHLNHDVIVFTGGSRG